MEVIWEVVWVIAFIIIYADWRCGKAQHEARKRAGHDPAYRAARRAERHHHHHGGHQ